MKNINTRFWIYILLTLAFMFTIFFSSNMPYEKQDIKPLLKEEVKIEKESMPDVEIKYDKQVVSPDKPYEFIEFLIRKSGHIVGYLILTVLLLKTLSFTRITFIWQLFLGAFLSLAYAGLDEWHQTFVPGRTGHIEDVLIFDAIGIILALLFVGVKKYLKKPNMN